MYIFISLNQKKYNKTYTRNLIAIFHSSLLHHMTLSLCCVELNEEKSECEMCYCSNLAYDGADELL